MKKRILKYLKETPLAKSIVVSDLLRDRVILSYSGNKLVWEWTALGLQCPDGAVVDIHPLAAEALVVEEIMNFFRMEGVDTSTVAYINHIGHTVDGVIVDVPHNEESPFDITLKKEKIKDLYERFVYAKDCLTEEMIGEAISFGVLTPFLSLVNL